MMERNLMDRYWSIEFKLRITIISGALIIFELKKKKRKKSCTIYVKIKKEKGINFNNFLKYN